MNSTHDNGVGLWSSGKGVQILMFLLVVCIYGGGVFLNTKIIQVSRREKEISWMLDVTNSIVLMFHFAHIIIMYEITYVVQDLYLYLGEWYCYVSKVITMIGNAHSTQNSFVIALFKYVMILHFPTPSEKKKKHMKYFFSAVNIIYPVFVIGMFFIVMPDFIIRYNGVSQANRCLGMPEVKDNATNNDHVKIYNACTFIISPDQDISFQYIFYWIRKSICWLHVLITYLNFGNILEMIMYCRIFTFMHRYYAYDMVIDAE